MVQRTTLAVTLLLFWLMGVSALQARDAIGWTPENYIEKNSKITPDTLTSTAVADTFRLDKDAILAGIKYQRNLESPAALTYNHVLRGRFEQPEFRYRTNYYTLGLDNYPTLFTCDGFIEPDVPYGNAQHLQLLQTFDLVKQNGIKTGTLAVDYPFSEMLTEAHAGMGDYEFNFARVSMRKDNLLGRKELYSELDFLGQNGYWEETIADQTSSKIKLIVPIDTTRLYVNVSSYEQNFPSTELVSQLDNGLVFRVDNRITDFNTSWETPYGTVGWRNRQEKLKGGGIFVHPRNFLTSLQYSKDFALPDGQVNFTYQFNHENSKQSIPTLYTPALYGNHLLSGDLDKAFPALGINLQTQILKTDNKGYIFQQYAGKDISFGSLPALYSLGVVIDKNNPDLILNKGKAANQNLLAALSLRKTTGTDDLLHYDLNLGMKQFATAQADTAASSAAIHRSTCSSLFSQAILSSSYVYYAYTAKLDTSLQWLQYHRNLWEQPQFQYAADLSLLRDLPYNNALSAGMNLVGHSNYVSANPIAWQVSSSLMLDVWAGVRITDLFEFRVVWKNVGNTYIYDLDPQPSLIMANVRWFFLN